MTWRQIGYWRDSIRLYERAIEVTRNNYVMESNLAYTLREARRLDEARDHALASVQANPNHFPAYMLLALISEEQNRLESAAVFYQKALAFQPRWLDAIKAYGRVLLRLGRLEEARAQFTGLVDLAPNDPEARLLLASLLATQRKPAEAILQYREAVRLEPNGAEALNNLAWLLATHRDAPFRDGAEAVRLAERACELSQRRQALYVGTLAAAYAEAGRFEEAVRTAQHALALATAAGEKELAATNARLLELYRANKAYREETPVGQ
jgi:Flp pilus assembly protein TadD